MRSVIEVKTKYLRRFRKFILRIILQPKASSLFNSKSQILLTKTRKNFYYQINLNTGTIKTEVVSMPHR